MFSEKEVPLAIITNSLSHIPSSTPEILFILPTASHTLFQIFKNTQRKF